MNLFQYQGRAFLYLGLFRIVTDILNKYIFSVFDYKFIFILSFMKEVQFFQPSMTARNKNFVN